MILGLLKDGLLIIVCLVTIWTDYRWQKIPNWLTFPAIIIGFLLNGLNGWAELKQAISGFTIALLLTLPLFTLDMVKAGDVKLVVAWGTIKGAVIPIWQSFVIWAFLYGAIFGGVISLLKLLAMKKFGLVKRRIWLFFLSKRLESLSKTDGAEQDELQLRMPVPYGVGLSVGALVALFLEHLVGQPFLKLIYL